MTANELYEEAVRTMKPEHIDHHESDLYLKVTETSYRLIRNYDFLRQITVFRDQITGTKWYEIPFAYTPYWTEKCRN